MFTKASTKVIRGEPDSSICVEGDVLLNFIVCLWCRTIADIIGNDAHLLWYSLKQHQLVVC